MAPPLCMEAGFLSKMVFQVSTFCHADGSLSPSSNIAAPAGRQCNNDSSNNDNDHTSLLFWVTAPCSNGRQVLLPFDVEWLGPL